MSEPTNDSPDGGMSLDDVYFVLFKHKWWIAITSLVGIAAAATLYFTNTQLYQSNAKILVKYVADQSALDPAAAQRFGGGEMSAIGSELEILRSWDLAMKTAEVLGTERLGVKATSDGARMVMEGTTAQAVKGTSVLEINFKHTDPELARVVLAEFIRQYLKAHYEIHAAKEAIRLVEKQLEDVKSKLTGVDEKLKTAKEKANIFSIEESTAALTDQSSRLRTDLRAVEAEIAEQKVMLDQLGITNPAAVEDQAAAGNRPPETGRASPADKEQYLVVLAKLDHLRREQLELTRYKPEAPIVKLNNSQIARAEQQRRDLESRFPELAETKSPIAPVERQTARLDPKTERARALGLSAKAEAIKQQLKDLGDEASALRTASLAIADAERERSILEANYKHIAERLAQAGSNQVLTPAILPNISTIQEATPAMKSRSGLFKALVGLAGGGIAGGVGLAFAFEILMNRTIKRPLELESRLGMPLLLSIPNVPKLHRSGVRQLHARGDSKAVVKSVPSSTASAWESGHFIRPFAEAIRDRLVLWFQLTGLTRRPKLVAVTAMSPDAGVSTLSGGLAAALSDTGDGKVLLVNMNVGTTDIQPFYEGKVSYPLKEALDDKPMEPASENLYLATVGNTAAGPAQLIPKRFYDLIPHLKASDFDYIIFDMPPLSQSSATLAIAGFMDHVLFVVEAERNNRDDVKRGYRELIAAKAMVSGVFNKGRSYAPKWLGGSL